MNVWSLKIALRVFCWFGAWKAKSTREQQSDGYVYVLIAKKTALREEGEVSKRLQGPKNDHQIYIRSCDLSTLTS